MVHQYTHIQDLACPPAPEPGSSPEFLGGEGEVTEEAGKAGSSGGEAGSTRPTRYCYLLAGIACLNSCNLGYDVGSIGGAGLLMKEQMGWSEAELSVFIGCINFFAVAGAVNASFVTDRIGRRGTFIVSSFVFIAGLLLQMLANSFIQAMAGRFLIGLGVGVGLAIDPLYISETSPPWCRGHLVSFSEMAINLGIMLGFIADATFLDLPPGVNWRVMLGLGVIMPSILIVLCLTVLPESPRWLVMMGRADEAVSTLERCYPPGTDVQAVVKEIEDMIEADRAADVVGWRAIFCPSKPVRLMLLAGVGLCVSQQLSGIEMLVYFSPETLASAGFNRAQQFQLTVLVGAVKTFATLFATFKSDQYGRRPLLFASTAGILLSHISAAIFSSRSDLAPLMLLSMCLFMASFSLAMGPVCWIGTPEVFPTRIRAKALSLATSLNRLASGTVASTTLPLRKALGITNFFLFYAVTTVITAVYLWAFFPETRGKSLEQIETYFHVKAGTGGLNASRHHWKDQEEGSSTTSSTGLEMAAVSSVASQ